MFKIPTEQSQWTADDAAALRQFLNTLHGQAFLRQLYSLRPLLPFTSPNAPFDPARRMAESEQLAGYEKCIQDTLTLTISPD
jgi:hypothetical protein